MSNQLYPPPSRGEAATIFDAMTPHLILKASGGYDAVMGVVQTFLADNTGLRVETSRLKSFLVEPFGTRLNLVWKPNPTEQISLLAQPSDWSVSSSNLFEVRPGESFWQDTSYWPTDSKSKTLFYRWCLDNETSLKRMTFKDIHEVWQTLGVRYDSH